MEIIPNLPNDVGLECLIRVPYEQFSSVASVCRSWKHEIELEEFSLRRKAAGLTRKVIVMAQARVDPAKKLSTHKYSATPFYRLTLSEPETGHWTEFAQLPGFSDGLPLFCQLIGVGLNLVVIGGLNPITWEVSNTVFVYNFVSATWRRGADMPGCRRSFFACASDSNRMVFVAGGHDSEKCALKSAMAYDVAGDKWIALPDMARARDESKGIFHSGKFHVIGGYGTSMQGRFEAGAEALDVASWQWDVVQDDFLDSARCPRNCVDCGDGSLYMPRGPDVAALQGSTWRVITRIPADLRHTTYVTGWQGNLLVIGSDGIGGCHRFQILDVNCKQWKNVEAPEEFSGHVQSACYLEL